MLDIKKELYKKTFENSSVFRLDEEYESCQKENMTTIIKLKKKKKVDWLQVLYSLGVRTTMENMYKILCLISCLGGALNLFSGKKKKKIVHFFNPISQVKKKKKCRVRLKR